LETLIHRRSVRFIPARNMSSSGKTTSITKRTNMNDVRDALGFRMKIVLACPTYGPVNPEVAKHIRFAAICAANNDIKFVGDVSTDRLPTTHARNSCVREAMKLNPDGIMWVDSDMKPEADHMVRLLNHKYHFVSGLYFRREGKHDPLVYDWTEEGFVPTSPLPMNALVGADGCGFGWAYTSISMLKKMEAHPDFDPHSGWFPDKRYSGGFGDDLGFCDLARKAGIPLYVDTSIIVGHEQSARFIGLEEFMEAQRD